MIDTKEVIRWLRTLPKGSQVGIGDDGLSLRQVDDESVYLELGGKPKEEPTPFEAALREEEGTWKRVVEYEQKHGEEPGRGVYWDEDSDYLMLYRHVSMEGIAHVYRHERTKGAMFVYMLEGMCGFNFTLWSEVGEKARPLFASFWEKYHINGSTNDRFVSDRIVLKRSRKKATKPHGRKPTKKATKQRRSVRR